MAQRTLAVVSAGLGQPSATRLLADRLAAATVDALGSRDIEVTLHVIEARDHARDLTDHLLTGFPSPKLQAAIESVTSADGLIAVTPVFSASYSGLFKTFFDVLEVDSLRDMPVAIAATGGTPRHSLVLDHALRPLFAYLNAAVVPTGVFAASDDWGDSEWAASLVSRIGRSAGELAAVMAARDHRTVRDRFQDPIPFHRLLAGLGEAD